MVDLLHALLVLSSF